MRYGVAGGLLLALAAYLPAPEEPSLPFGKQHALKIYDQSTLNTGCFCTYKKHLYENGKYLD